jgi:hypothetical protein
MGFKSLIATQVQGAMRILGTDDDGLAPMHTYVSVDPAGATYDPVTRRTTDVVSEIANVPMALVRFKIDDMTPDVKPKTDRKALIAALDLPAGTVPNEQDRIQLANGGVYTVLKVMSDPSDSLFILHVRLQTVV